MLGVCWSDPERYIGFPPLNHLVSVPTFTCNCSGWIGGSCPEVAPHLSHPPSAVLPPVQPQIAFCEHSTAPHAREHAAPEVWSSNCVSCHPGASPACQGPTDALVQVTRLLLPVCWYLPLTYQKNRQLCWHACIDNIDLALAKPRTPSSFQLLFSQQYNTCLGTIGTM